MTYYHGSPAGGITTLMPSPGQARRLYAGQSGWLYTCETEGLMPGNSPWIAMSEHALPIASAQFVSDVYAEILRETEAGTVRIKRYEDKTEAQKQDITEMYICSIFRRGLLDAHTPKAAFIRQSFPAAWSYAQQHESQAEEYVRRWEEAHLQPRKSGESATKKIHQ